ncbi:MAG: hypothetical protein ACI9HK_002419 [Pirellulaceae bacterium]|jgi:hypothetical protein
MTPKLTTDLTKQIDAQAGQPLRVEHPDTHKVFVIVDSDTHERAMKALQKQEDIAAIQIAIEQMEAGEGIPLAEARELSRQRLRSSDLSIKSECLNRMIFFGEVTLRKAVNEYLVHYHQERNHQGIGHKIIHPGDDVGQCDGELVCKQRLGGMLNYYHRKAA